MIWVSSACPVGIRVAARLTERTGVLLSAPRDRIGQAREAVAALLGRSPGERLRIQPDDIAPGGATAGDGRIDEIWHLAAEAGGGGAYAARASETGAVYRRFDVAPVAEGPGEVAPGAFSTLMQALDATIQEVRSREPDYFERRALRATLPAPAAFLDAERAAAEVLSAASGAPGHCRIAAEATGGDASCAIGDAYEVELILGAEPSSLSAVDRLFESRLGALLRQPQSAVPARHVARAGARELAELASSWRRHHDEAHRAERARLGDLRGMAARPPAAQVFGKSGPWLVIVNAVAQDLGYWVRLVDRLSGRFRVLVFSPRSLRDDGEVATLDDHARELESLVDGTADGPLHLAGWCTGPKLCVRYALAHPDRVASMVFLAGTYRPFGDASLDTTYETTLEMVFKLLDRSPGSAPTVRGALLEAVTAGKQKVARSPDPGAEVLARTDPELLRFVSAVYATDESTLRYAKQIRDFWSRSIEPDVGAIRAPVLVVGAELDRIASSRLGQRVAQAMPTASYVELPGATHYCMHDRPDDVARLIGHFIGSQEVRHG